MAYKGINFRSTAGYRADGAGETYSNGEVYPTTRNGQTFGWSLNLNANSRDRSATSDRRLAGVVYNVNTAVSDFRLDLESTGVGTIRLALGELAGADTQRVQLLDGGVVFATLSPTTNANFADAAGNLWNEQGWPTSNVAITHTFTSTNFTIRIGDGSSAGNTRLTHVSVDMAAADTTAPTMTGTMTSSGISSSGYTLDWSATTRADNVAIAGFQHSPDNATWSDVGNVTNKSFTGKAASTLYPNYVRTYDSANPPNYSTPALLLNVTTLAASGDNTVPSFGGSIVQGTITSTTSAISWGAATDNVAVDHYEVSKDGGATWANIGNVLNYTFTGLIPATVYEQRVRAHDAAGNISAVLAASVTTLAAAGGTVVSTPFENGAGGLLTTLVNLRVAVLDMATTPPTMVKAFTGRAVSGAGVLTCADAAIIAGTKYGLVTTDSAGNILGAEYVTAT